MEMTEFAAMMASKYGITKPEAPPDQEEAQAPAEIMGYSCEYAHAASQLLLGNDVTI